MNIRVIYNTESRRVVFPTPRWTLEDRFKFRDPRGFEATPASWGRLLRLIEELTEPRFEVVRGCFEGDVVLLEELRYRKPSRVSKKTA